MNHHSSILEQVLERNPRKAKKVLSFLDRFTVIGDILVDREIFNYTFKCTFPSCGLCCFAGTVVTIDEINRVTGIVDDLKPYLSESKVKRLDKLGNSFYTDYPVEGLFKLRTWNRSCIYLMEDERCAVHKYCLDNGIDWVKFHFDLCVTYPLRISRSRGIIHIEEELYNREYVYHCFNKKEEGSRENKEIDLVYYMKEVIIDRFGQSFWEDLENRYKHTIVEKLE